MKRVDLKQLTLIFTVLLLAIHACAHDSDSENKKKESGQMKSERFTRGWKKLQEIDGEAGERVAESLEEISPELGTYIIEYAFGDVYTREGLDLKSKELAVVAALTAMGNAEPQLKVHIHGALNVGCSILEVKEVILQMSAYSGFPRSINGMNVLKAVLNERKSKGIEDSQGESKPRRNSAESRYSAGAKRLSALNPGAITMLNEGYGNVAPELVSFVVEQGYGDMYATENLSSRYRQIATIAALTALGNAESQLEFHIKAGLAVGLTVDEIKEIMILMSVYAGFPASLNGTFALKRLIAKEK